MNNLKRDKYAEQLVLAQQNAKSFTGLRPPNSAWYIGSVKKNNETYHYYTDEKGNFYYDSQSQRDFETKMREIEKKRRREKYSA